jgi:hypothetical protein
MGAGTTLPATVLSAGTVSGAVNGATWNDLTGSGAGWNGTVAISTLLVQGPWSQTAGTALALGSTASGSYTGSAGAASIVVTVNGTPTATNTPFTWTDREGATTSGPTSVPTCVNGTACAVNNGVTITFATATPYIAGDAYTAHVGIGSTTAMSLATGSATAITNQGTTLGGSNLPTYTGNLSTVTAGGVGIEGTAVKFVTAAANAGAGSFTVTPGVTFTWDPNNTWSSSTAGANYTATAQYTIATGP